MRLALTDPLTGLGNHRHFHDRLERELADSRAQGYPLSLCLVDIDDFKRINDRFGHPGGDKVLAQLATNLRQGGEAFRLGGDEFAILLPGRDEEGSRIAAEAIVERIAAVELEPAGPVTISAGIATAARGRARPGRARARADSALYWAKEYGKNQVRVYRPDVIEIAELKRLAAGPDRAARFRAAASLAQGRRRARRVHRLALRARRRPRGPDRDAARRRPGAGRADPPRRQPARPRQARDPGGDPAQARPALGGGAARARAPPADRLPHAREPRRRPVADWVLHHHERWDGSGYPDGVGGEEIPLGARIIFVADAYDAMTSDRVYRGRLTDDEAIAELDRCSGTQFDPEIVAALADELGVGARARPPSPPSRLRTAARAASRSP